MLNSSIFPCRKDSFITHRAFCDALAEESARLIADSNPETINNTLTPPLHNPRFPSFPDNWNRTYNSNPNIAAFLPIPNLNPNPTTSSFDLNPGDPFQTFANPHLSDDLLQPWRPTNWGHLRPTNGGADFDGRGFSSSRSFDQLTRDFLGVDSGEVAVEQFLPLPRLGMDEVTLGPCVDDAEDGDRTKPVVGFGFPPVGGAWGDHSGVRD